MDLGKQNFYNTVILILVITVNSVLIQLSAHSRAAEMITTVEASCGVVVK